jgi:hypothetical protein
VASRVVATPGVWRQMNFGGVVAESEENSDEPLRGYPVMHQIHELGSAEVKEWYCVTVRHVTHRHVFTYGSRVSCIEWSSLD